MPHPRGGGLALGRMDVQMRVIHEEVRPERLGNHVDHRSVVEQLHEPRLFAQEREQMERRGRRVGPVATPDGVDRVTELLDEGRVERARKADVPVLVEASADPRRPPFRCDRVHRRAPLCRVRRRRGAPSPEQTRERPGGFRQPVGPTGSSAWAAGSGPSATPPRSLRAPKIHASAYRSAAITSKPRYPVMSAMYSSTPPSIAPSRFAPNAVVGSSVSRKREANTRFAMNTGKNARAVATKKRGTVSRERSQDTGTSAAISKPTNSSG